MKRSLRLSFVATSLLLCLLSLTLWGTSYVWSFQAAYTRALNHRGEPCGYRVGSGPGCCYFNWSSATIETQGAFQSLAASPGSSLQMALGGPRRWYFEAFQTRQFLGPRPLREIAAALWFAYDWSQDQLTPTDRCSTAALRVPLWFPTLLFSILPLRTLRTYLRARREKKKGFCPKCGYDLRATPLRCPECGAIPNAGTKAHRHEGTKWGSESGTKAQRHEGTK